MLKNFGISKSDWKDPLKREVYVTKFNEIITGVAKTEGVDSVVRQLGRMSSAHGQTGKT